MKCSICNNLVKETFLKKLVGTYVRKEGKLFPVCFDCQSKFRTKAEILGRL